MSNTNGTITIIPAPEGYLVDFDNPQVQFVVRSYTVAAVEMSLAFLFLVQRMYTKLVIMKKFQLEDGKSLLRRRMDYSDSDIVQEFLLLPGFFVWALRYVCFWG
jgi:hypothetical protein